MLYLLLAIVSSMLVSVTMRLSEGRTRNSVSLLAMNYLMCTVLSGVFAGSSEFFPAQEGLGFAVWFGVVSGALYLGSFMLLQWNIRINGVVLPATFMKLGVLVPTLMSILVFREVPRAAQVAGILLAVLAIVLVQSEKGAGRAKNAAGLVILLLGGGLTDATSKIYEELGVPALENHFLLYTFAVALLLCALLARAKGQSLSVSDAAFGLLIGIPNYFSARFLLLSLSSVPAVAAYPTYSVGTIVLITLIGVLLFRERISRRQALVLLMILAALALLNL